MLNKTYIPWAIVAVLAVLLIWSLNTESGEPEVIEKHTTDTLIVVKTDTLYITDVIIKETPKDTVYITSDKGEDVPIPISEYEFSEEGEFDFRVSGYNVNFLGATIYPKTVYQTITTQAEKTIKTNSSSLFVFGGFSSICGDFSPKIGVGLSYKGKWLISGDIGLYKKEPIVGVNIGYNILQK